MATKTAQRANAKILRDAREYLELVGQLTKITKAVQLIGDQMTPAQVEFITELKPLIDDAAPVIEEVMEVTTNLNALPSTAPKHKRRALARKLNVLLAERATNSFELIQMIMKSASLFGEDLAMATDVPVEEKEVVDGQ